ncbi:uncharacterized protein LOC112686649 isoform X2 [Sipha flava]|uniref:Uncharacterized protein LOC112686649 isoform X2 n=1 Tax=Sipha flava TaxID=143950 RepID=A0A2S2PZJ8_9HEMI|nr:uncharacterized protein LOC112686649 isoform X2 [Sipha flava]
MMNSMLSYILLHKPDKWETVNNYDESYKLFDLEVNSLEYINIITLFNSISPKIKSIKRVQNPFQYGRFKLRQEMLQNMLEETAYYVVHMSKLKIALKFTCDYRRLTCQYSNKQPCFISSVSEAISKAMLNEMEDKKNILILSKIPGPTKTQSKWSKLSSNSDS